MTTPAPLITGRTARLYPDARRPLSRLSAIRAIRPLVELHRDPRYSGDLHRADMEWALYAAVRKSSAAP
jgi:hypothetical protein